MSGHDSHHDNMPQLPDGLQIAGIDPPDARRRQRACWVIGTFRSHSFFAKVYPKHRSHPGREIGTSRISNLEIRQIIDNKSVAYFGRRWQLLPQTRDAQEVLDFLATSLADWVYSP